MSKNLVATQLGWVDQEKGILVKSIRGLSGAVKWDPETNTFGGVKAKAPKKEAPKKSPTKKAARKTTKKTKTAE